MLLFCRCELAGPPSHIFEIRFYSIYLERLRLGTILIRSLSICEQFIDLYSDEIQYESAQEKKLVDAVCQTY